MLKNTPEIIAVRCPFSHSYCPPIFPLCLKLASNMSSSQTSSGNSLLPHSPADSFFLSPVNFKLTALPWSGRPPLSHCFTFSFVLLPSPHFCPLTLTHTPAAPLSLSLCPDDPHLSCQLLHLIGHQHCSSRPIQPIQTPVSQAGRRRCLQIPMRDSFSHLRVTSCDAFRRGL